jgi:C2 domain
MNCVTVFVLTANPIFDESFEFQINLPELALVRFAVLDDDFIGDEFIGQYTIPFACMQPGQFVAGVVCLRSVNKGCLWHSVPSTITD